MTRLSELVGVTLVNLSVLKNDRARAIRFSTLSAICAALECEIGELLVTIPDVANADDAVEGPPRRLHAARA